ncbi:hypothetical protein KTC96_14655 [Clostridium estertheticum]|nr:hypothetical protein [Clostridium estertheticum]WLC69226.1 hypothetical protein KTC96_14655 [Clostridium estertheticum]
MKNKKGSALIFTLIVTSFLLIVLTALLTMSASGVKNVDAYNKINSAYYAGEAGVQRVIAIMDNECKTNLVYNSISVNGSVASCTKEIIKPKVDAVVRAYVSKIELKKQPFEGKKVGSDIMKPITASTTSFGYYLVKPISIGVSEMNNRTNYNTSIKIISEGHFSGADGVEHIKLVTYNLNVSIIVRADPVDINNCKLSLGWNITS